MSASTGQTAPHTPRMDLLRFATAGSVDDGKSTLIGRLLYDSKSIFEDQLESVERTSRDRGEETANLALLTDGLRAERERIVKQVFDRVEGSTEATVKALEEWAS